MNHRSKSKSRLSQSNDELDEYESLEEYESDDENEGEELKLGSDEYEGGAAGAGLGV